MRLSLRYVLELLHYWLRLYWWWMSSGSLLRFGIGYAVPIIVVVFLARTVSGGGGWPSDLDATQAQAGDSEVVGAGATPEGTAANGAAASGAGSPTPAPSVLTYVVKSGDTLGAICTTHVPSMATNACVTAIVELNKLGGPDQLSVGQSLTLPAAAGRSSSANPPASNVTGVGLGATTATPGSSATASAQQQAAGGIKIGSLTSPIKPGETATLQATVPAKASCTLQYAPPAGTTISTRTPTIAGGLVAKAADDTGNISWSWDIAGSTKKGRGVVVITCGATALSSYIEIS